MINSSPPNATELRRINTAFRQRLGLETPLKTPKRNYAFRLTVTAEKLTAQVSLLEHENTKLKKLNAQRKQQIRGTQVALKDRLLLTVEELRETARVLQETGEEKQRQKVAKPRKTCKRKAQEMEASAEKEVNGPDNNMQP